MKLTVTRDDLPATKLNVEIISDNPAELGKTKPIAFILPGGPGAALSAYLKYSCLKEVADLVFHDPRGCGESDKGEPASYNMTNYIDDVEVIRQALTAKQIIVIGKSYGSMCALGYALKYPLSVAKLVLAAGAPSYRFLETAKQNLQRIGTLEQIQICEKLWAGDFKSRAELLRFFELTNPLYSVKAAAQPNAINLANKSEQFSYEVLNEGFRQQFWQFDYENALQDVACPALVLGGKKDWINDIQYAQFMAERIPSSKLIVFDKASHAMEADVAEEYFQHVADFITPLK